jgi:ribonuclease G
VKRVIVINASALETRVALLEDNSLAEFYVERQQHRGLVGNIYKGKVTRVLPGMQAAFIDIGLERAGFLHVSDFLGGVEAFGSMAQIIGEEDVETEPVAPQDAGGDGAPTGDENPGEKGAGGDPGRRRRRRRTTRARRLKLPIEQQLRRNQEIIVQIAKEPMGNKGARLTSSVSLPGRFLVYMPTSNHLGISRRIESAEERGRMRAVLNDLRPPQGGFIVRTACENVSRREIQRDIAFLTKTWQSIVKKNEKSPPAAMLYSDLDVALRTVRDLFSSEIERLWCDDPATYGRIVQFVQTYMPRLRARVQLYESNQPVFDYFQVEPQIERALDRKVWLKSGGYLVFDQAEALTAIDVNTGRFVGKKSQDETVLRTNLEAVDEVVRQLRLRNIGGIIIVDFIDMAREADRKRVNDAFRDALRRDKSRTSLLRMSELGLIQMTRRRTRESLEQLLTEQCPRCLGRRVVKSVPTLAAEVLRGLHREVTRHAHDELIMVKVSPEVARYLYDFASRDLEVLEQRLDTRIVLRSKEGLDPGSFELAPGPVAA